MWLELGILRCVFIATLFKPLEKPIVLTPLRNVRRLGRLVDDFKQERRHRLKEERTEMIKRKLYDQAQEERDSNMHTMENKENLHSTVISVETNHAPDSVLKQVQKAEQVKTEAGTSRKPNKRDEFVIALNDLEPEQLKSIKVRLQTRHIKYASEIPKKQNRQVQRDATIEWVRRLGSFMRFQKSCRYTDGE